MVKLYELDGPNLLFGQLLPNHRDEREKFFFVAFRSLFFFLVACVCGQGYGFLIIRVRRGTVPKTVQHNLFLAVSTTTRNEIMIFSFTPQKKCCIVVISHRNSTKRKETYPLRFSIPSSIARRRDSLPFLSGLHFQWPFFCSTGEH